MCVHVSSTQDQNNDQKNGAKAEWQLSACHPCQLGVTPLWWASLRRDRGGRAVQSTGGKAQDCYRSGVINEKLIMSFQGRGDGF